MKRLILGMMVFSSAVFSSLAAEQPLTNPPLRKEVPLAKKDSSAPIVIGLGALAVLSVIAAVIANSATSDHHPHSHPHGR